MMLYLLEVNFGQMKMVKFMGFYCDIAGIAHMHNGELT